MHATIPSLPISYERRQTDPRGDGRAETSPPGWQGGLPLPYHVGPGPAEVNLRVEMDYQIRTIWNVIATIKGEVEPDKWVMVGNHRDARGLLGRRPRQWHREATLWRWPALARPAVKQGWKPRRTLVYASWDAEEYGLVGSTEWCDEHCDEIIEKAVMLLNVELGAVSGPELDIDGVPSLRDLLLEAAGTIHDVRSGRPLRDVWMAKRRAAWAAAARSISTGSGKGTATRTTLEASSTPGPRMAPRAGGPAPIDEPARLGVGLHGVPRQPGRPLARRRLQRPLWGLSLDLRRLRLNGEAGDPEFVTHHTAAKLYTLVVMRAAGAEVVPLKFTPYGEALREYVDDLRRMVARKARTVESDTARPPIVFDGLPRLVASDQRASKLRRPPLDAATDALAKKDGVLPAQLAKVNDALTKVERSFLIAKGLPGRTWFRHAVYAPGLTTGYASWTLPGVRQAVIDNDAELLGAQVPALAERIDAATAAPPGSPPRCSPRRLAARLVSPTRRPPHRPPSPAPAGAGRGTPRHRRPQARRARSAARIER